MAVSWRLDSGVISSTAASRSPGKEAAVAMRGSDTSAHQTVGGGAVYRTIALCYALFGWCRPKPRRGKSRLQCPSTPLAKAAAPQVSAELSSVLCRGVMPLRADPRAHAPARLPVWELASPRGSRGMWGSQQAQAQTRPSAKMKSMQQGRQTDHEQLSIGSFGAANHVSCKAECFGSICSHHVAIDICHVHPCCCCCSSGACTAVLPRDPSCVICQWVCKLLLQPLAV